MPFLTLGGLTAVLHVRLQPEENSAASLVSLTAAGPSSRRLVLWNTDLLLVHVLVVALLHHLPLPALLLQCLLDELGHFALLARLLSANHKPVDTREGSECTRTYEGAKTARNHISVYNVYFNAEQGDGARYFFKQ